MDDVEFALGFQIDGNDHSTRFWFYDVTASKAAISAKTTKETIDPDTDTLGVVCKGVQLISGVDERVIRGKTTDDTDTTTYNSFFSTVYVPTITQNATPGSP